MNVHLSAVTSHPFKLVGHMLRHYYDFYVDMMFNKGAKACVAPPVEYVIHLWIIYAIVVRIITTWTNITTDLLFSIKEHLPAPLNLTCYINEKCLTLRVILESCCHSNGDSGKLLHQAIIWHLTHCFTLWFDAGRQAEKDKDTLAVSPLSPVLS